MSSVFAGLLEPPVERPGAYIPDPTRVSVPVGKREQRWPTVQNPWGLSGAQYACLHDIVTTGDGYVEIGKRLCISDKTVTTHMYRARDTMKAKSMVHAVLMFDRWMRSTPNCDVEVVLRYVGGKATVDMREVAA